MKIQFRGPAQSQPLQENKPVQVKFEPPPARPVMPDPVQQRRNQDSFAAADPRTRQAQLLGGGTTFHAFTPTPMPPAGTPMPPGGTVVSTAQVLKPTPTTTGAVSPGVQAAIDQLDAFPPEEQPYGLTTLLGEHRGTSAEDVAFRQELMTALGSDRVAQLMTQLHGMPDMAPGLARTLLSAATESFSVEEQGKLVQALGPDLLGEALAWGVQNASNPLGTDREANEARMQGLSRMMGALHSLPPGSPGQAEAAAALEGIQQGQPAGDAPGASTAAWIVANSGSDALRSEFAHGYLEAFKADPSSLAPEEARAVAWALGSMTQSPTNGVGPIVELSGTQRTDFLGALTAAEAPEMQTGTHFQDAARAGVNEFLMDVARLDPAGFSNPQAAKDLRVETFLQASLAVDGDFLHDSPGTHRALATLFANDTAGIVDASANPENPLSGGRDKPLVKFFDHVAFRGEDSRSLVTDALQKYLGVGAEQGIVDTLAANKGSADFMENRGGNALARNMGFVLGSLFQGARGALQAMDDEHARKTAIVDVMGSLMETTLEAIPGVKDAYSQIKSGTGDRASVDTVFEWLGNHFAGDIDASKDAVTELSGAIIEGAWDPFFGNSALDGANTEQLIAMFGMINVGVSRADGSTGDPGINIGAGYVP
ncbi:hypothetical protein JYK02_14515 [Corallococcus macrosporus]|uniref:Uncharacterized protein n=1 Tax=Corallococcus macrosporus TaxID=35 RepID=A0ABS3DDD6_9BACT|nr:hypothetical protein [Corallococcus macrosporus]MBN8228722.1 hypothetical protein [Corallococcus macrosporus]